MPTHKKFLLKLYSNISLSNGSQCYIYGLCLGDTEFLASFLEISTHQNYQLCHMLTQSLIRLFFNALYAGTRCTVVSIFPVVGLTLICAAFSRNAYYNKASKNNYTLDLCHLPHLTI